MAAVGYGGDPIPDDPAVVALQVAEIRATAGQLALLLTEMSGDGQVDTITWESSDGSAVAEFEAVIRDLPKTLDALRTRYVKVGDAMEVFCGELRAAKAQAYANLPLAVAAHIDLLAANVGVKEMADFAAQARTAAASSPGPDGSPPAAMQWPGPNWPAMQADAHRRFVQTKYQIASAVERFRRASAEAARAVNGASHDSLRNHRSYWGSIGHAVFSAAHWVALRVPLREISQVLNRIVALTAIVALCVSWMPIIGQVVDAVDGTVLATAAIGALACDSIGQLNQAYEGDFHWTGFGEAVGGDVINVAFAAAEGAVDGSIVEDSRILGITVRLADLVSTLSAKDEIGAVNIGS